MATSGPAHHADEEVAVVHAEVGALRERVHGVKAALEGRQAVGRAGDRSELVGGDDVADDFRGGDGHDGQVVGPETEGGDAEQQCKDCGGTQWR